MEEPQFHPLDYVSVVHRRKWWFIVPMLLCVIAGVLLVVFLPRTYRSVAEIGVAAPTLSAELLRGLSSLDPAERQRAISQQLLSRTVLERVVREERIAPERPVETSVGLLRQSIEIDVARPIGNPGSRNGLDSFQLSYLGATPERTQAIANRIAYVFVEENSRTRTEVAQNTSEVLAQQLRMSQDRLIELERQLGAKKQQNIGQLPDQINANISMLNGLRSQQESLSLQVRGEQERLVSIESQLESMRQGVGGSTMTSAGTSAIQNAQSRINQLQQELMQARALGWLDKHPEVVRLESELKAARAELSNAQKNSGGGAEGLQTDPMYRQKLNEREQVKVRIRGIERELAATRGSIGQLTRRVEAAPMVEQDLASLVREHELEKRRYQGLSDKHQSAVMAEEVARKQGGERFSVLYPATLPGAPETPNIIRLLIMSVGLGFALGAGLVVLREFMDRSVHDARGLTEFDIPVLGEIPRIHGAS